MEQALFCEVGESILVVRWGHQDVDGVEQPTRGAGVVEHRGGGIVQDTRVDRLAVQGGDDFLEALAGRVAAPRRPRRRLSQVLTLFPGDRQRSRLGRRSRKRRELALLEPRE